MINKILFIIFALFFSSPKSFAKSDKINFELARIDGSKFISNQDFLGKKTILIFFDIDCPPCVTKLNNLKKNPPNLEEINIAIINLSVRKESKIMLLEFHFDPKIELLQAPSNPKIFLKKFGNNSGSLPYLTLLNQDGILCLSQIEMPDDLDFQNCN